MVYLNSSVWKTILALAVVFLIEEARSSPREIIEKKTIYIGGLFGEGTEKEMVAFKAAASQINMDRLLLPGVTLEPKIEFVSPADSFTTGKRVCNLTMEGVAAIFGPSTPETAGIVQSICDTMDIPHILTHWNPSSGMAPDQFNMYPDPKLLSQALVDVLEDMDWKTFTIIYESDEGLVRLQEVLKRHGPEDPPITVRQLGSGPDYRPLLKEIHNTSETHIVLDVDTDRIMDILRQAKEVKMMEDYQSYLITSLDAHTLDFGEFKWGYTNISGMRYINPQAYEVQSAVQNFMYTAKVDFPKLNLEFSPETLRVSTALMYDAVYLFAESLHKVDTENTVETESITCDSPVQWKYGNSLINFMKIASHTGLSGLVNFNGSNYRKDFSLDLLELHTGKKTGTWDPTGKVNLTRTVEDIQKEVGENLANKTMLVTSRIGAPYLTWKANSSELTGTDRFEGYSLDLIHEISLILGFKYEFYLVPDGNYGSLNPVTKKWDGLIRQLIDRKADLAICDLTITFERERAVDFTMPFMNLGISILFSRPVKQDAKLFSFLAPLSVDVWLYMATAFLGVSVLLFVLARMTPYEWDNPHPCNPDPDELENTFTLLNSLWFAIGSLMQQGCDFLPKAVSTRIVAGMWWFFTLIMISSYTANLAAFLTVDRMDASIESAEDLAKQTKIKYGLVDKGSTKSFFMNSNFSTYQRMWAIMDSSRPSVFMKDNKEGVDRVTKGKGSYAFLMESTSIEYEVERNCELQQVGNLLDSKGYGIAMPVNSPYRTAISGAVLKLQEEGRLSTLKAKWWKKKDGDPCDSQGTATDISANELGLANVGGVFVVLISGCGVAFLVSVLEFLWNSRKVAIEEKITPAEALRLELKFAMRCRGTTKPVHRKSRTPNSNVSRSLMHLNVFQKLDNSDK